MGDSFVLEQSGGQPWELWFLSGLGSCVLFEADLENKQETMLSGVTPSVVLEGFSVDILKMLHFLEKLGVPLTTLAQIPMKQPQP